MLDNYMLYVWLGVFVVALIVEGVTTELVSVWFAVGALVALPFGFFKEFWISIIVFVVVSTVALIFTRPIVKRITQRKERKTNVDDVIGKKLKTITDITKFDAGEVKLNGIVYTAILREDEDKTISKDKIVEVVSIKGNRLVVKEIEGE
ncbi:MAG: NfeD family protein [Acholeplasmatales bacterium]|nr:NfeD family protein [Acholeplasmatales bacterium]